MQLNLLCTIEAWTLYQVNQSCDKKRRTKPSAIITYGEHFNSIKHWLGAKLELLDTLPEPWTILQDLNKLEK